MDSPGNCKNAPNSHQDIVLFDECEQPMENSNAFRATSPCDRDRQAMPPPSHSPVGTTDDIKSSRRPRSESFGHLSKSGNLLSRQSFEGYPSILTEGYPSINTHLPPDLGRSRSPAFDNEEMSTSISPATRVAMLISPTFRQSVGSLDDDGRSVSVSPGRYGAITPNEDVFSLGWNHSVAADMPQPPSKEPPPSPKPQPPSWKWSEHEADLADSRRRKLEDEPLQHSPSAATLQGRFDTQTIRMDGLAHSPNNGRNGMELDEPTQFRSVPMNLRAQMGVAGSRTHPSAHPSFSVPSSPSSEAGTYYNKALSSSYQGSSLHSPPALEIRHLELGRPATATREPPSNPFVSLQGPSQQLTATVPPQISTVSASAVHYKERFDELERIYVGCTSSVYRSRRKMDQWVYAVKRSANQIKPGSDPVAVLNEVYALAALAAHPRFVRYFGCWVDHDVHLYTQLEYCCGGTLAQHKQRGCHFTESNCLVVLQQVASGLQYLHAQGLVHRGLSSHCLFVTANEPPSIKIGHLRSLVRTVSACADEHEIDWSDSAQARSRCCASHDAVHNEKMSAEKWLVNDVFAIAMVLLDLSTLCPLPAEVSPEWEAIRAGQPLPLRPGFSQMFQELLCELLRPATSSELEAVAQQRAGSRLTANWVIELLEQQILGQLQQSDVQHPNPELLPELQLHSHALQLEVERQQQETRKKARHIKELKEFKRLLEDHRQSQQTHEQSQTRGSGRSRRHPPKCG